MQVVFSSNSKIIKQEFLFHGEVSLKNDNPTLETGIVFCASTIPLGEKGVAGQFNVHAHYSTDVFTHIAENGTRSIDEEFHRYFSIQAEKEIDSIRKNGIFFLRNKKNPSNYDEAVCSVDNTDGLIYWYNDFLGAEPIEGHVPVSQLIK